MVKATLRTAVIGAGMAGLTCAQALRRHGVEVVVFDKGRGLGGRMATRRAEGGFQFDHGVQYLTARTDGFSEMLKRAEADGAVARWPQYHEEAAYIGMPGMTGLAKYLGLSLNIRTKTRIESIVKANGGWEVFWEGGNEVFDRVVITVPAPQIDALLPAAFSFDTPLDTIQMVPCLTMMVGLHRALEQTFVSRRAPDDDMSWIVCDSAKPGRPETTCIVAQADRDWSLRHLEYAPDDFAKLMLPLVCAVVGTDVMAEPAYLSGHRWRYGFVSQPLGQPYLVDKDETLFAGGDWCLGAKVEHAWSSGHAIAEKIANGM